MTATGNAMNWQELSDEVYSEYDTTARKGVDIMQFPVVVEIEVYDDEGNRLNMKYHAPITGWKLGRDKIILTTTYTDTSNNPTDNNKENEDGPEAASNPNRHTYNPDHPVNCYCQESAGPAV